MGGPRDGQWWVASQCKSKIHRLSRLFFACLIVFFWFFLFNSSRWRASSGASASPASISRVLSPITFSLCDLVMVSNELEDFGRRSTAGLTQISCWPCHPNWKSAKINLANCQVSSLPLFAPEIHLGTLSSPAWPMPSEMERVPRQLLPTISASTASTHKKYLGTCEPVPLEWQQDTRLVVKFVYLWEERTEQYRATKTTLWGSDTQLRRGGASWSVTASSGWINRGSW